MNQTRTAALCRLWSTKQEQEKVPDEEATKRKQEAADAKVRCLTNHESDTSVVVVHNTGVPAVSVLF